MILCFSCHTTEFTTELVMDWINSLGGQCRRINGIDIIQSLDISIEIGLDSELKLSIEGQESHFDVAWFRKWMDTPLKDLRQAQVGHFLARDVSDFRRSEYVGVSGAFFLALENYNWLDLPPGVRPYPSKLHQLKTARQLGIRIPQTILTNNKRDLKSFLEKNNIKSVITKPVKEIYPIVDKKGDLFSPYTCDVTKHIDSFPDLFFPSKFQENIAKQYEVRVFFLDNLCYAMAIFSASDDQTKADFRNYNWSKPNRTVPHQLPADLTGKIVGLMKSLQLKSGSLDFIVDSEDEYIFLEVNPAGQFGMVSFPCNYYLEKVVAQSLINHQRHE